MDLRTELNRFYDWLNSDKLDSSKPSYTNDELLDHYFRANSKYINRSVELYYLPTENVNRVEVVDKKGRSYVNWDDNNRVRPLLQDMDRTLKIFISKEDKPEFKPEPRRLIKELELDCRKYRLDDYGRDEDYFECSDQEGNDGETHYFNIDDDESSFFDRIGMKVWRETDETPEYVYYERLCCPFAEFLYLYAFITSKLGLPFWPLDANKTIESGECDLSWKKARIIYSVREKPHLILTLFHDTHDRETGEEN